MGTFVVVFVMMLLKHVINLSFRNVRQEIDMTGAKNVIMRTARRTSNTQGDVIYVVS